MFVGNSYFHHLLFVDLLYHLSICRLICSSQVLSLDESFSGALIIGVHIEFSGATKKRPPGDRSNAEAERTTTSDEASPVKESYYKEARILLGKSKFPLSCVSTLVI